MNLRSAAFAVGLAGAMAACAPAQPATEADVEAINAAREAERAAINSGNPETALAVYTSDVAFLPPNEAAVMGNEDVRSWFQAATEQATIDLTYTGSEIMVAGDWAIERYTGRATFTPKDGSPAMTETLKGIHIYRRQADGTWKIAQDIWNSDQPMM